MADHQTLHRRFRRTVEEMGGRAAVLEPDGRTVSYRELGERAAGVHAALAARGVAPGDRVGFYLRRSADALAILFGTLEAGGVYVPADPSIPVARAGLMFKDCGAKAVFADQEAAAELRAACERAGHLPQILELDFKAGPGSALARWLAANPATKGAPVERAPTDPAFMLYTSGSTGVPKGVLANHIHGDALVDWCLAEFRLSREDRISMVTPYSFAFSILDIHVMTRLGATGVIIPEALLRQPRELVRYLSDQRIGVWVSVPSTLNLLVNLGRMTPADAAALKLILFAGEEYPIEQLKALQKQAPAAEIYNLFGTTETGVCMHQKIPRPIPEAQTKPFPFDRACSNIRARLGKADAARAENEGELLLSGPGVMLGYWNRPELNAEKLVPDADGRVWHRTGDLVQEIDGCFTYISRIDRMIKKRGYRIEPGEIENRLYHHAQVEKAAVFGKADAASGDTQIVAFVVARKGSEPSVIELKKFCAETLPSYMVPDRFVFLPEMPLSSPSKIDAQKLKAML